MKNLAALASILVLFVSSVFSADKVSFPGPGYSTDPTERYLIECEGPLSGSASYRLFLKKIRTGERRELQAFDHSVEVYWAPDGGAVAVTEWNGVNVSDISIYFPENPENSVNMQEALARSFRNLQFVRQNREVYFQVLGWRNPATLRFKVWGRGDYSPDGFEKYFEYTLRGKVKEIKKP